jgi:hypothetical protein
MGWLATTLWPKTSDRDISAPNDLLRNPLDRTSGIRLAHTLPWSVCHGDKFVGGIVIPARFRRADSGPNLTIDSLNGLPLKSARRIGAGITIPPRNLSPSKTDYISVCARRIPEVLSRGFRSRSQGAELRADYWFLGAARSELKCGNYYSLVGLDRFSTKRLAMAGRQAAWPPRFAHPGPKSCSPLLMLLST